MGVFQMLEAGDPQQVGPYRIVARLGSGGMGRVYLGRSRGGRAVAVKVVRQELADDREFQRRFAREVAAARRVNGVFTAGVVDADPDGSPAWLATVYVPGVSLGDAVAGHGPWPEDSVLALGAGLAEALEAIHAAGVVHRDLKPSNILLAVDGPRVIDFGISVAGEASALTQTGMLVGTPGFMSPEQLTGKQVGPASDVFSLGAVLAFAAGGAGPFGTGSAHALNFRVVYEEPDLHALTPALRDVVEQCLAKKAVQRPTVMELLDHLASGVGDGRAVTEVLTETSWMPAPVATKVRSRNAAGPPTPPHTAWTDFAQSPAPTGTGKSPSTERSQTGPPGTGSGPRQTPHSPKEKPHRILLPTRRNQGEAGFGPERLPPQATGPKSGADPAVRSTRITRRRVLLGLAGATVAGVGALASWRILDSRAPERRRWKYPADLFLSSPTMADGVVYVGGGFECALYAVDATTGKQRWTFPAHSLVCSSPAVALGVVYVGSADRNLYAVNVSDGKQRWKFPTGGPVESSPAVADGVVYVGSEDGNLYAVSAVTGDQQWKFPTGEWVHSSPAVAGGVVYFGSWNHNVYALDAVTGEQRWKFPTKSLVSSSPAVADGVVYVGSDDGNLYAVNVSDGKQRWKFPTGDGVSSSSAVADGVVYVGSNRNVYAVEADTGEEQWKFPVGGHVPSVPAVVKEVVYFGAEDGNVYAVDTSTGEERWRYPAGSKVNSSPAVIDGVLYVGCEDGLHAVSV
ncbi:PQQ-binding-like beta-propeller repeat protein [Streptomyces sp. NPDC051366]|uniref:outer membrane protein assembly factor BamB family protein n=1 Tax=Streptomyces sp. NPDC051366 TaxID=3365652 RepID=UPI0037A91432